MEWQPIETAPKGQLLLYFPEEENRRLKKPSMIKIDFFPVSYPRKPTHWMPLPDPPEAAQWDTTPRPLS